LTRAASTPSPTARTATTWLPARSCRGAADLVRARKIAGEWRDQEFSFVDSTSFAFIERLGITSALAFDTHFRIFRWGPGRRRKLRLPGER